MLKLRIFLADDHPVVRAGLKALIDAEPDMKVVGEAANGREAVERIERDPPDVAVLDISMPELTGAQATVQVRASHPGLKVLALTVHEDRAYLRQLLQAGAAGYVLKRAAGDDLIRAIRAVAAGGTYLDTRVAGNLVSTFVDPQPVPPPGNVALSARETEVIRLIARGFTNKEVGAQLGVSAKTIETHKMRSMEKLGLRGRVDLVQSALERGWLREQPGLAPGGSPAPARD
jgi:DNA-binding NarL/FixJ family response regulator